jgi:hypothetical protein
MSFVDLHEGVLEEFTERAMKKEISVWSYVGLTLKRKHVEPAGESAARGRARRDRLRELGLCLAHGTPRKCEKCRAYWLEHKKT